MALITQPKGFHVYSITGPESLTGPELVSRLQQAVGVDYRFNTIDTKFTER
jgi:uncharacterized protein YbjT (DUF2867 family)